MDVKRMFSDYVLNTYTRTGPVFVKGKGSFLWDDKGKKYLDLFPGWGVDVLGHSHPRLCKVLSEQGKKLIHIPNNLYHPNQALLAREIIKKSFKGKVFFANSGAEAVEGALKLARIYGKKNKHKNPEIICMRNSFHGRTMGTLSLTAQKKYQDPFKPLLTGVKTAKFGDFKDLKNKITKKTAGILLEPIQGEGGVNLASKEYFQKVKDLCKKNKIMLIFDEVQTGMGRTGAIFCYQNYGIEPDAFTLSKGLGGGFPISALVIKDKHKGLLGPGMHASTFGGSPLATRVSLEVFKVIQQEQLLRNAKKQGKVLEEKLSEFKDIFGIVKDIRGKALMWAMDLNIASKPVFQELFKKGVILNSTQMTVLRIMPALNIDTKTLTQGLNALQKVLRKFQG